jgi:hypothetical protein
VTAVSLRRILLLAGLAAVVPASAFALEGEASPAGVSVAASQGGCGISESQIICEIEARWTGVPGTEYYTVSVTGADGSVQDFGRVGGDENGGSASLWVPYVGSGTYSVMVSAYGTPPGEAGSGHEELLGRESSDNEGGGGDGNEGGGNDVQRSASNAGEDKPADQRDSSGERSEEGPREEGPDPRQAQGPEPVPEGRGDGAVALPECEAQPATKAGTADSMSANAATSEQGAESAQATEPPTPAELVACEEPSSDSQGPCCPPGA